MNEEKVALIFEIYRDFQDFFEIFEKNLDSSSNLKPENFLRSNEPEKSLFYLTYCLRDALVSIARICDPQNENLGLVMRTNEYWDRIQTLFPNFCKKFS
jgi:hypothetical protein